MNQQDEWVARNLLNRGVEAYQAGHVKEALTLWTEARTTFRVLGLEREAATCEMNIGVALSDLGQLQEAIEHLQQAKTVFSLRAFEKKVADCDMNIGTVLWALGQPQEAIEHFQWAKTVFSRPGFEKDVATCEMNIGVALLALSQPQGAIEHFQWAKTVFSLLGLEKDVADCETNIGNALRVLSQSQEAIGHYQRAKAVYSRLGFEKEVATCGMNIGTALWALGQSQEAIEHYQRASVIFSRLGCEMNVAGCEMNIGNALTDLGQSQEAIEHYQRASAVYSRLGLQKEVADCEMNIGVALSDLGQPQQAIEHYQRARAVYSRLGFEKKVADCDVNTGVPFWALGQPQEAIRRYQRAKAVFFRLGFQKEMADCEMGVGTVLWALGHPQEAIEYYQQAKAVFSRLSFEMDVAGCEMNIGVALSDLGQPQEAIECYQWASAVFSRLGYEKEVATCEMNVGNALRDLGQRREAIEHLQRAKAVFSRLGFEKDVADCENNTGTALADLAAASSPETAFTTYQQATKHLDEALLKYEQLRSNISVATHRISFFEQFARSYRAAIHCCLRLGHIADALHYLERSRAKSLAEAVSGNLVPDRREIGEELYAEFFNLRSRLHQLGILPLIRSDSGPQTKAEDGSSERGQAQHDFNSLVQRIATRFPNSTFARRLEATEVRYLKDVAEYVSLLPDNRSCLLEFLTWGGNGRLRAFVVTKQNDLELLVFPEGSLDQLAALWNHWARMYDEHASVKEKADIVSEICGRLHETLFDAEVEIVCEGSGESSTRIGSERLLDYLNRTLEPGDEQHPRRMYLIPHATLFLMPLHAACWDEPQRPGRAETAGEEKAQKPRPHYLLEDYVVVYAPSAYLLKVSHEREYSKPPMPRAIIVGNPQPLSDASPLPYATVEAQAVAKQLEEAGWEVDTLIEREATKQRFLSGDEERGVAGINSGVYYHQHLAQHAGLGGRGHQAHLYFGQLLEMVTPEQYVCDDRDIAGAPLHKTRSVVAAACLTSATSPAVNEYLGMGAAFLQAGVGTFIGTLYRLSDAGSSRLVPELYRLHLREGLSWADALRRAQLQMAGVVASGASQAARQATMSEEELVDCLTSFST